MLVGNKVDICNNDPNCRKVTTEEGEAIAKKYHLMFTESSAIVDINVTSAFEDLLQSFV